MEPRDVTSRENPGQHRCDDVGGGLGEARWRHHLESLLETHRRLLAGTRLKDHGGSVRAVQNWIGGSDYNPCSSSFVPPPPEDVPELLDDLMGFCNDDSLPALAGRSQPMRSSRPSTHSRTATGVPDAAHSHGAAQA